MDVEKHYDRREIDAFFDTYKLSHYREWLLTGIYYLEETYIFEQDLLVNFYRILIGAYETITLEDWMKSAAYMNRAQRNEFFFETFYMFRESEFPKALALAWSDFEKQGRDEEFWGSLFMAVRNRELLMTEEELEVYRNLPDEVEIYRGGKYKDGISWTLKKEVAEFFKNRFNVKGDGKIFTKIVKKKDTVCYFNGRNEQEVIVL